MSHAAVDVGISFCVDVFSFLWVNAREQKAESGRDSRAGFSSQRVQAHGPNSKCELRGSPVVTKTCYLFVNCYLGGSEVRSCCRFDLCFP